MQAQNEFNKALKYLDFGKTEKGEDCLKNAIQLAENENDTITLIKAFCCYGDLLCFMGKKAEAKPYLEHVASYKSDNDILDYEVSRAKELLLNI
jgi:tetratricopeptide (TPR) repeat protein